ncbi:MAG: TetR/AcrR family transcriptional regulator [Myxococcales bacterium]|nr:TetR/AcrR family transcriptional regulator [Myxococcales bacterium]
MGTREGRGGNKRGELREPILAATASLFLEKGYEGLSMRQIADAIGYTATTIYRYFANKDELLFALVEEGFMRFVQSLLQASRSKTEALPRLLAIGKAYVLFGIENPLHYRLMFMQRHDLLMESRDCEATAPIRSFSVLTDAVEYAMKQKALRQGDVLRVSHMLWAAVHGLTTLYMAIPRMSLPGPYELIVEDMLNNLLAGLAMPEAWSVRELSDV